MSETKVVKAKKAKKTTKSIVDQILEQSTPEAVEATVEVEVINVVIEPEVPVEPEVVEALELDVETLELAEEKIERRGRPILVDSARQIRLAARAAAGNVGRGRPANPNSARQARLEAMAAKVANGIEVRPGRPKGSLSKPTNDINASIVAMMADVDIDIEDVVIA